MNQHSSQRRAVIYTRVSSDEQTKGYGLEYQLEDCRRAVTQHGHHLTQVYSDPGISGTLENRPGLTQLRDDAKKGRFDILYFWKSDRLARDEILQLTLYREFRHCGIETYSVSEPNTNARYLCSVWSRRSAEH
jgi:site-specific DNA recombinase